MTTKGVLWKPLPMVMAVLLLTGTADAQGERVGWSRGPRPPRTETRLFHSTVVVNLPTAETLQRGFYQFEISHRFVPPFSGGFDDLYGLDGPVNIRLGLGYAPTDHLLITLARSNVRDNVDLQVKYGRLKAGWGAHSVQGALIAGVAWNTDVPWRDGTSRDFQPYLQAVINVRPAARWALGIVPTFLYNAILESEDVERALTLGVYGQWYLTSLLSLLAEWNVTEDGYYYKHDAAAFGIELETGGHFFKIVATNSAALNPSQFVVGTSDHFEPDNWRLGFNITRLLKF